MKYTAELKDTSRLELYGGKASNLAKLTDAGFNVPAGFAISTIAYDEFIIVNGIETVIKSNLSKLDFSSQKSLEETSSVIVGQFEKGKMTSEISAEIKENLRGFDERTHFAVRSSATAEDLPSMSFAGLQDTYLNIKAEDIEKYVKKCFASLWSARAISYRNENNILQETVKLSVVVQRIIDADVSGVVFTINPANNDYDELVINANFGLGESVVSGAVEPDNIIINKYSGEIIEKKIGSKQKVIIPKEGGNTEEQESENPGRLSLSDSQILELSKVSRKIEDHYDHPMDIEWCIKDDKIYILQARHITTYIPIPEEMQTKPDEERLLYIDFMVSRQGIEKNFSVLGINFFRYIQKPFSKSIFGTETDGIKDGFTFYSHGRGYVNLSNMYSVFGDRFLNQWERVADSVTLATMKGNIKNYRIRKRPRNLRFAGFLSVQSFVFSPRLGGYFRAFNKPKEYLAEILEKEEWLKENIKLAFESYESLNSLSETLGELYSQFISVSLMATYASEKARVGLDKLFAPYPEMKEKVNLLERSLPGNITVLMGLDMFELSGFPEIVESKDYFDFSSRKFSKIFSNKWETFMEKYGFRCPMEIDMKSERPWENPKMVFDQIKQMSRITEPMMKPDYLHKKSVSEREKTYVELMEFANEKGFSSKLPKNYEVTITLGGYRETHKYYIVMIIDAMKKEILKVAKKLVADGRLNDANEIFDLKVVQIDEILENPSIDVQKLREENTRHIRKTEHIKHFPTIIDSRGRIPVPPKPEEKEGQLLGEAISAGRAKGRVKVLKSPTEKEILPGEILVARTTDPGWTPLFINAAAVVLEIGGMLQHGAMVAREYGKPCVAGVIDATEKLKDGMLIEVDGSSGTISIIDET